MPVAIKRSKRHETEASSKFSPCHWRFEREVKSWANLIHPNILPLCGYRKEKPDAAPELVSPYVPEGTLKDCYMTHNLSTETKRNLVFDAALGLAYLHEHNLVHLDIKASNILVTHVHTKGSSFKLRALLCDFGYTKEFLENNYNSSSIGRGSMPWQAWEVVSPSAVANMFKDWEKKHKREQLHKADVWSWGMTVLEVYSEKQPYHYLPEDEIVAQLSNGKRPSYDAAQVMNNGMDSRLMSVMQRSWELNPLKRISMKTVLDDGRANPAARPPTTKLHKDKFPFISHLKVSYKNSYGEHYEPGTTVQVSGAPSNQLKDGKIGQKMPGWVLKAGESGIFPVQHARKILGPKATDLPHGVLYYMRVWKDYDGKKMYTRDETLFLQFEAGDVIAVTDAPANHPWTGEIIPSSDSGARRSGLFLVEAVEVEYLAN
ncbi:kinase-like protein [Punctularia strigosozonata HHB-11173 SS5]|uniref:kinase-like protein n=1 Tax=Punctularia strigosozonata (strain HHB-11173) TaxID=741275 RepID=UPI000441810C|nr:kinase-like protein [Punctularia strigosozonata HHB-11173 SS5]EIN06239.1 kinase-like protein [Punctularia strigosozonata HHB-11173 SS5]